MYTLTASWSQARGGTGVAISSDMERGHLLVWPAALAVLCAGCGDSVTTPTTGAPHPRTPSGEVSGEVVSQQAGTVVLASSDGSDGSFLVSHRTPVTRVVTADAADIVPGTCVAAGGGRAASGFMAAWVLVEAPAGCARPGAAIAGRPPAGLTLVVGTADNVSGQEVSVHGPAGAGRFSITVATPVGRVLEAGLTDLIPGRCVVARGRTYHAGRLAARHVQIVPTPIGGCLSGSGGIALLASVEPGPGSGAPPSPADLAGGGGGSPPGVSAGGTVGGGAVSPFPLPQEPEGSNLSPASPPPRPLPSPPPELLPQPAPPPQTPDQRPGGSTPAPGSGVRPHGPSPAPGRPGAPGATPSS